jgi:hypothetical protein
MKKVYIVEMKMDYGRAGGRPKFVFLVKKEHADKWCDRLCKENDYGWYYEGLRKISRRWEITDLKYRIF